MNPFDLPGPQFLALYAIFGIAVLVLLYFTKRKAEAGELGRLPMSDPYMIAYLRGGAPEALRLSITVLIDRKLLDLREPDLLQRHDDASRGANELERAILDRCTHAEQAGKVVDDRALQEIARRLYEPELIRLGLLAGPDVRARRSRRVAAAIVVLVVVAAIKLVIGLSRNRPVSFLVASAVSFSVLALIVTRGVRTVRGDRILDDLKVLFDALRGRASGLLPNVSTNELALLVAVFGLDPLPALSYPFVRAFRPKPASDASSCGSGYTCGASSSGGGSSSSGSGCGGGGSGCGGGGGGCGGCGSS